MNLAGVSTGALATEILGRLDQSNRLAQGIGWLALPVVLAVLLVLTLRPRSLNHPDT
jgi:hypothetical protein